MLNDSTVLILWAKYRVIRVCKRLARRIFHFYSRCDSPIFISALILVRKKKGGFTFKKFYVQAGKYFFLSSFDGKIAKCKIRKYRLEILGTNGKYATVFIFLSFSFSCTHKESDRYARLKILDDTENYSRCHAHRCRKIGITGGKEYSKERVSWVKRFNRWL